MLVHLVEALMVLVNTDATGLYRLLATEERVEYKNFQFESAASIVLVTTQRVLVAISVDQSAWPMAIPNIGFRAGRQQEMMSIIANHRPASRKTGPQTSQEYSRSERKKNKKKEIKKQIIENTKLTELIELADDGLDVTVLGRHVSSSDGHFKRALERTGASAY